MSYISFEWDYRKNTINKHKHGVSFEEAKTTFYDPNALIIHDPDHSIDEERFILLGLSYDLHILVVCHCYRSSDRAIRMISARKATKDEQKNYKEHLT